MTKKSGKHSFLKNLSVDSTVVSSADVSADAPAIINIINEKRGSGIKVPAAFQNVSISYIIVSIILFP